MFGVMSAMAQEQSRSIGENVAIAYHERFKRGEYNLGNNRILGYDSVDGQLVPNEDAWIIRFIYERFVEGDTYSAISKQLEEKGARRLRSDKPFSASAIIRFTDTFSAPSAGPLSKGVPSRIPVAITRHGTAPRGRRGRTGTAAGTWSGKRRSSPMRSVDSLDGMPLTRSGSRKQA